MAPAARDAQIDFVRLAAEEPSSLYFEDFLRGGFGAWPISYQERFPHLDVWSGVSGLKQSLRELAGAPADWNVLLAGRSLSLVNLAARCQFRVCRNVLATDLSWPTYQRALKRRAARTGNRITITALRERILRHGWTASDVAEHLAGVFVHHRCDGLFLPAVDHLGIRLPIGAIVRHIEQHGKLRFVFIDAAQAYCQVAIDDWIGCADFIVAGSHKWLHAYLPMGLGFFGRRRSQVLIGRKLRQLQRSGGWNDPLLHITEQLSGGDLDAHSETANLTSLFAAAGAVADNAAITARVHAPLCEAEKNLPPVVAGRLNEWRPVVPSSELRSRICLLEPSGSALRRLPPHDLRRYWLSAGCVVSAYPGGLVRVSMAE